MRPLREVQARMAAMALDRGAGQDLARDLRDDRPIALADRLRIHRNNTILGLADPLAATFPVVKTLVGDEFFERMAHDFIRACPPKRPELLLYGQELPGFTAAYAPAAAVPYLADMARLELALAVAENAADRDPLDPAALQAFAAGELERLTLAPHPSLRFVASDFPLLAIWQAHQEGGDLAAVDLARGGDMLLIWRPRRDCLMRRVSAGAFAFVMALAAGQDLAAAYESAVTNAPDFSLPDELAALLAAEIFVEAKLP
jgi:hypothetical protein